MSEPSARLRSLIEPLVEATGLYLFDLEQTGGKLIVTVEKPQGGADMAAIAAATKAICRALDDEDPISGKYLLEVTSPGVERPLRVPAHFTWALGKEITVRLHPESEGERRHTGVLLAADDDGITIAPAGRGAKATKASGATDAAGEPVVLSYDDIERARTVFDFEAELHAAKHDTPGHPGTTGGRKGATTG